MPIFPALRDYGLWRKQSDRSVPTPWKRELIERRAPGSEQRLLFVMRELASPADKTPEELEYLQAELNYFRKVWALPEE